MKPVCTIFFRKLFVWPRTIANETLLFAGAKYWHDYATNAQKKNTHNKQKRRADDDYF